MPIKVYEVATRRLVRILDGHVGHCVSLDFSGDGTLLASGSYDGTARIWSTGTWKQLHVLQNPDPLNEEGFRRIASVDFAPDRTVLALGSRLIPASLLRAAALSVTASSRKTTTCRPVISSPWAVAGNGKLGWTDIDELLHAECHVRSLRAGQDASVVF